MIKENPELPRLTFVTAVSKTGRLLLSLPAGKEKKIILQQ